MAKWNEFTFEVTGRGEFPLDMLRHDRCWPARGIDADIITQTGEFRTVRLKVLCQSRVGQVTQQRWKSFGWPVNRISP